MAAWKIFVGRVEIPKLSKTLQEKVTENRKRRTDRFMLNTSKWQILVTGQNKK